MRYRILVFSLFCFLGSQPAFSNEWWYKIRLFEKINPLSLTQWSMNIRKDGVVQLIASSNHPKGLYLSSRASECIPTSGHYVTRLNPKQFKEFSDSIEKAIQEQSPLNSKTAPKTVSSPMDYFKIEKGSNSRFESISIIDRSKPAMNALMLQLEVIYEKVIKSPVRRIKLEAKKDKYISLVFTNDGKMPLTLAIPETSSDSITLIDQLGNRVPFLIVNHPKKEFVIIKSGQSFALDLNTQNISNKTLNEVRYQNHSILNHIPNDHGSFEVSICYKFK